MDILTIGRIIQKEREACGLTQRALAAVSHVSRVTIVNLENGRLGDIGAVKLSGIAAHLGIALFATENKMDAINMTLGNTIPVTKTACPPPSWRSSCFAA